MRKVISFTVAGTTFENRQGLIHYLKQRERNGAYITYSIAREKDNDYDPLACKVLAHVTQKGHKDKWIPIGYVPKTHNAEIAATLDANKRISKITGGFHGGTKAKKNVGCHISLIADVPTVVA